MGKLISGIIAIALIAFTIIGVNNIVKTKNKLEFKQIELRSTEADLIELKVEYDSLNNQLNSQLHKKQKDQETINQLKKDKQKLQKHRESLERQLQAKANNLSSQEDSIARVTPDVSRIASALNCGDNIYKQYIYQKESGCNPSAVNSIGCRGVGQSCPGDKLPCGADFACQDKWFSNYAVTRYGSWKAAYNFWINNHWW